MRNQKQAVNNESKQYRVEVVGITDLNIPDPRLGNRAIITHIWCDGVVIGSEPKFVSVNEAILEKLQSHPRIKVLRIGGIQ